MEDHRLNEALKVIHGRHSVRQFQDRPVDDALIKAILDAANRAPSAHNQQSWKFIVVKGDRKRQLAELVTEQSSNFPKPSSSILRMAARSIMSAPVVIAVMNTGTLIAHGTELFSIEKEKAADFFRTMEIQSSAAAAENLLIAATSLGLGSVWLGVLFLIKDKVLESFGEARGEFMAVIPIGYPLEAREGPKKKSLEYVVRYLSIAAAVSAAVIVLSGCGKAGSWIDEQQSAVDKGVQGRTETVNIEALGAVGQNSTAVRRSVDKVLNANDARNSEAESIMGR
ncbi:MAG: nitroreductase family protein [Candidatus Omnitrophota bacterium]